MDAIEQGGALVEDLEPLLWRARFEHAIGRIHEHTGGRRDLQADAHVSWGRIRECQLRVDDWTDIAVPAVGDSPSGSAASWATKDVLPPLAAPAIYVILDCVRGISHSSSFKSPILENIRGLITDCQLFIGVHLKYFSILLHRVEQTFRGTVMLGSPHQGERDDGKHIFEVVLVHFLVVGDYY